MLMLLELLPVDQTGLVMPGGTFKVTGWPMQTVVSGPRLPANSGKCARSRVSETVHPLASDAISIYCPGVVVVILELLLPVDQIGLVNIGGTVRSNVLYGQIVVSGPMENGVAA